MSTYNKGKSLINRSHGFTLVETLVAVAVLMIAIAGPLVIATKGLTSALYSKDQMIASFLAQDTMEVVKNIRDNNVASAGNDSAQIETHWLDTIEGCEEGSPCDVGGINPTGIIRDCGVDNGCPIYFSEDIGYDSDTGGNETQFSRRFYLTDVLSNLTSERRIHVIVEWRQGSIPFEVHLTSTIAAAVR